jgi:hypothetical protein
MLKSLLLIAALALFAMPARASMVIACDDFNASSWTASPQHPCPAGVALLAPITGSQEALGVVTATTLTVPAGATIATITIEGNSVRYRCDGTAPTASTGSLLAVGTAGFVLVVNPLSACQFIQTAATATLDVEYWHQ